MSERSTREILGEIAAAGLTPKQMALVMELSATLGRPTRAAGAERTARWRERHKASQTSQSVTCDAPASPSSFSPIPPHITTPSPPAAADADARGEKSNGITLTPEAFALAKRVTAAMRVDPDDPRGVAVPYTTQKWLNGGWDAQLCGVTVEQIMAKRTGPPRTLAYFEPAIADAHADQQRSLPFSEPRPANGPSSRPNRAHSALGPRLSPGDAFAAGVVTILNRRHGRGSGAGDPQQGRGSGQAGDPRDSGEPGVIDLTANNGRAATG